MMLLLLSRKSIFINFSKSNKKFCLSLLYNGRNSFLFVNATKMYQFRVKDSDIKKSSLSLGIISGDFSANNMTKTGLTQPVHNVLVWSTILAMFDLQLASGNIEKFSKKSILWIMSQLTFWGRPKDVTLQVSLWDSFRTFSGCFSKTERIWNN